MAYHAEQAQPNGSSAARAPPGVIASAATGIVEFIEARGGDVDRIFGHVGIAPDSAGSPTLKLKLKSYSRATSAFGATRRFRHPRWVSR